MSETWILDLVLGILLVVYTVAGFRSGFVRSVAAFAGVVAGGVAAYFLVPYVATWVPQPVWRVVASIALVVVLLVVGHSLGVTVGRAVRARLAKTPLRGIDRMLGAVVNVVAAALVMALAALSVTSLGVPALSQPIGSSVVLRTIGTLTPDPVEALLAQLRASVLADGLPIVSDALGGVTQSPDLPVVDTGTAALTKAAASVVRITGNAFECGQNQSGSGFVVAKNRVVTNAHVVAGVSQPIVELPGGGSLQGRVVYFDPAGDLAVIAVSGLGRAALPIDTTFATGQSGVVDGYPFGGPFSTGPAKVLGVATSNVEDIYGSGTNPREIYTLAADVRAGNSGGPLLTEAGAVAGVVFARSLDLANVGYAITTTSLGPVAVAAPTLTATVASGSCTRE